MLKLSVVPQKMSLSMSLWYWTLFIVSKEATRTVSHEFVLSLCNHHQIFILAFFYWLFFPRMSSILFFRQYLLSQIFTYYQIGALKRYHLSLLSFYEITTFSLIRAPGVYLTLKLLSAALFRGRCLFQG